MENEKKLLSWKQAWKLNKRAYQLICKRCPKMVLSSIIKIMWTSLTPYVGIYLSARLINELTVSQNIDKIRNLVLILLGTEAVISLISALVGKWCNTQGVGWYYNLEQVFVEKMMSMDYVAADSTRTHEMYDTIKQNRNGGGWGLDRVVWNVEYMLSVVFTMLGGIALTISLFTSRVPVGSGKYERLNHPLFVVLILAIMMAVTYISPRLSNKANSCFALKADDHNQANRLFGYFGWLGFESSYASDVRMYRQDLICDKYNNDKTGTFGSNGTFAKLVRGWVGWYCAASAMVSVVFTGTVYVFVCLKALGGAFGIGSVTQYVASITKVSESVTNILRTAGEMRNNASFLKLIFEFLDIPNEMYQGSLTIEKRMDREYEIEFRDVSFQYPGSENYSLSHVNMRFHIGERLAVVGQNGSGKTTFIKLLCRLYDPTEGEILLNGINIRKYNYLEYMSIFAVVFQDFKLLAYTLGQNVATRVDYDPKWVEACLDHSGFGKRLKELPDGMDTYLYKEFSKTGVDVSGGEAQKIALARALYKDAPFIILDEPTAALDPIAEAEVYSNFNQIVGDKTAIYISHRLSSCRFCDEIAVFDHGQIVQQGSHDQLVTDKDGKYHELWYAQAQYYK